MDDITKAISDRTDSLILERLLRKKGLWTMVLEIKGIKGKALTARSHIERLNNAYDKFNEAAPAHASDVEGLVSQVETLGEDLQFAVNVLGNSTASSVDTSKGEAPFQSPGAGDGTNHE